MTNRSAHASLKGYYYQFNKTLLEILKADNSETITCEGIEDIDISNKDQLETIQCKHYEASDKEHFTLGLIYEPVIRMLVHYKNNSNYCDKYKIFIYLKKETPNTTRQLSYDDLQQVLKTTNIKLTKLLTDNSLSSIENTKLDDFISKLTIEFANNYEDLVKEIYCNFNKFGFNNEEIDVLFLPNAIHKIAKLSINKNLNERKITQKVFLDELKSEKKTILSKWVRELQTYDKIIKSKRKELSKLLNYNQRERLFLIDESALEDFISISSFLQKYVGKYSYKPLHKSLPIFCFKCDIQNYHSILKSLYDTKINYQDGLVVDEIRIDKFFKEPLIQKSGNQYLKEFFLRIIPFNNVDLLYNRKPHDLFLIGGFDISNFDLNGVIVENIDVPNIKQLEFILNLGDVYE